MKLLFSLFCICFLLFSILFFNAHTAKAVELPKETGSVYKALVTKVTCYSGSTIIFDEFVSSFDYYSANGGFYYIIKTQKKETITIYGAVCVEKPTLVTFNQ